jgi:hypothetical protein
MSLDDVDRIRQLVTAAVAVRQQRSAERDRFGWFQTTTAWRPAFEDLQRLAVTNPTALIAIVPSLDLAAERLVVCEALSTKSGGAETLRFWEGLVENESDEELLACTAVGLARLKQATLLDRLEAKQSTPVSLRLVFHLGIARLQMNDPRGVDHFVDLLRRDPETETAWTQGPTMRYIVVGLLKRLFPKGPSDDITGWIRWWTERRERYKWVDGSLIAPEELAYVPPLWVFEGQLSKNR